ncbi:MAG TPA: MBL fold metallo-hydrolase, partial [Pilimelia sp.]|nr:MBL fold metallo-hydrolase [Pilimelia sp.]
TLGVGHLDPEGAAEAVRRAGPRRAVPIHFGTLWPIGCDRVRPDRFHAPGVRFIHAVARAAPGTRVHLLDPGQSLRLP